MTEPFDLLGETMYAHDLPQFRSAELIRQAEQERLAREVARRNRAARREAALRTAETESHSTRPRRSRFPRTA
jgi:hypothetical protein